MALSPLKAISPVDGRYHDKTAVLAAYFSEYALIKYRLFVEIEYLKCLNDQGIIEGRPDLSVLDDAMKHFNKDEAEKIKMLEKEANHDVKAVEYYLRNYLTEHGLGDYLEFIHFGLTSQDVNNTAFPLMIKEAMLSTILPHYESVLANLEDLASEYESVAMLARTHGQPASPTRLGKEIKVFCERLRKQLKAIYDLPYTAKFGGATGNFNAHYFAYPDVDWMSFADSFLKEHLGLERQQFTTQIEHYDGLANLCGLLKVANNILVDFARDVWTYISMDYFKQKVIQGEVGSSAMPHKVNPIDFENAEGNFMLANSLLDFFASKLPVSRLQRDLTDSTVLRNIGVPLAHVMIACLSLEKGMDKLELNKEKINQDLDDNWAVIAEGVQTLLRKLNYPDAYGALKKLTRGQEKINAEAFHSFIEGLEISDEDKEKLKSLRPNTYLGRNPMF